MHNDFPIPIVPPITSSQPSIPNIESPSQTNPETRMLENGIPQPPPRALPPVPAFNSSATSTARIRESPPPSQPSSADTIPDLLIQQFNYITQTLRTCFSEKPPHTIQRFAELVLSPKKYYKTLPAWLRAVDRVVSVSSTADIFPLPHAQPLPGTVIDSTLANGVNGIGSGTGGGGILWTNSDNRNGYDAGLGSDESLGGALLTPIPWLKNGVNNSSSTDMSSPSSDPLGDPIQAHGNPMVPERDQGAVTQGELIRQEQEAGIIPVNQTIGPRSLEMGEEADDGEVDDSEVIPHARGPDIVGPEDIGLQGGRNMEVSIGGHADARLDEVRPLVEAGKLSDVEMKTEGEAGDEDIVLTDVDGKTDEQADEKADASGENVGPDAADTSGV
jgi:PPP4R2